MNCAAVGWTVSPPTKRAKAVSCGNNSFIVVVVVLALAAVVVDVVDGVSLGFQDGKTALHLAAFSGHIETVTALALNGAEVNAQDFVSLICLFTCGEAARS